MNKKLLFVYNPLSGTQTVAKKLHGIVDIFTKAGYDVTIHPTQSKGDCMALVESECKNYDRVVISGGDGTLNEAVNGMVRAGLTLPYGYIPAGSTNDFSHSVGIPLQPIKAAEVAVSGRAFPYDIGKLNDRYFTYVAAFGTLTEVSYSTPQETKNALGFLAYILEGAVALGQIRSFKLSFECKERCNEGEYLIGLITNTLHVAGMKNFLGKDISLDDGLFEVILVKKPQNIAELGDILNAVTTGKLDSSYIDYFKTEDITLRCEEGLAWTLDGENGGKHKISRVSCHKQTLSVVTK